VSVWALTVHQWKCRAKEVAERVRRTALRTARLGLDNDQLPLCVEPIEIARPRPPAPRPIAAYVASFIGHTPGKALFIGLYSVGASKPLTREQYWQVPANRELRALGDRGFAEEDPRSSKLWFDLTLTEFYQGWKGKLVVAWPPPERSWWRRAHKNEMPVLAILESSALDASVPRWDEIVISREELRVLPTRWKDAMCHWRGIYYIFDVSDGKWYVGSAYGRHNILQRWLAYASTGHGGNKLLRRRDPKSFRFSILQRVSPDMDAADVIQLESRWKERLHTREPQGLNDN